MADPLSGARMKLQRAEEHFGQLALEHALFLQRNPYRMLIEYDPEREGHAFLFRAKIIEHPPLEKWASLLGDCVHSLRSALDHIAFSLARKADPTVDETRPLFPLIDDPGNWGAVHPNKLPGVDAKPLALIERLQPYNHAEASEVLWKIHQLDIADKHRRLNLVNATVVGTHWRILSGGQVVDEEPAIGPFVDGTVCGRFTLLPEPDQKMDVQQNFVFGISLAEGEPAGGMPVIPLLHHFRAVTGGVVSLFQEFV